MYVAIPALPKVQITAASSLAACRMLSASSGPSTMTIGFSPCVSPICITFPAMTPREYFAMPLTSRFFPSGVMSTLWMPSISPSGVVAAKTIAGPSYTLGLNFATLTAALALRPRELR